MGMDKTLEMDRRTCTEIAYTDKIMFELVELESYLLEEGKVPKNKQTNHSIC